MLAENDQPLPEVMNVIIKKDELEVSTMEPSLAGIYNLKISAFVALLPKIQATFNFKLKLIGSKIEDYHGGYSNSDIVIAKNSTGPMSYQLPERLKSAKSVNLGIASSFLKFVESESSLVKTDESFVIPNGVYKVVVTGFDEGAEDEWSQNVIILIGVQIGNTGGKFDQLCCNTAYIEPWIASINVFGRMEVKWMEKLASYS